jgi:2-polyprenyl-6-methoxyphenol hydroxylase-like FAD-dependent oxidoreductase
VPAVTARDKFHDEKHVEFCWYVPYKTECDKIEQIAANFESMQRAEFAGQASQRTSMWREHLSTAWQDLPETIRDALNDCHNPWVEKVTSMEMSKYCYLDGAIVLIGEALAVVPPYLGAGCDVAAMHARLVSDYVIECLGPTGQANPRHP